MTPADPDVLGPCPIPPACGVPWQRKIVAGSGHDLQAGGPGPLEPVGALGAAPSAARRVAQLGLTSFPHGVEGGDSSLLQPGGEAIAEAATASAKPCLPTNWR